MEIQRLNWENIKDRFHKSWHRDLKPFMESDKAYKIFQFLKEESSKGKIIAPISKDVFRCFEITSLDNIKTVILGLCPYHNIKNGTIVADGLALSCKNTRILQPSLSNLYEAWEEEFNDGLCLKCDKNPDLSYLAKQGVLLFNAALTVEIGEAKSHNRIWLEFAKHIMVVVGKMDIPVIFLGNEASELGYCIPKEENKFFLKHPVWASYKKCKWNSEGAFTAVNNILVEKGIEPIKWVEEAPF